MKTTIKKILRLFLMAPLLVGCGSENQSKKEPVYDLLAIKTMPVKNVQTELKNGTIVTNPPYGERVYDRKEAEQCYKDLRFAFDKLDNWSLFLITSANNFEKCFGKKSDRDRKLYNSNKECKFYYYYKDKEKLKG